MIGILCPLRCSSYWRNRQIIKKYIVKCWVVSATEKNEAGKGVKRVEGDHLNRKSSRKRKHLSRVNLPFMYVQ